MKIPQCHCAAHSTTMCTHPPTHLSLGGLAEFGGVEVAVVLQLFLQRLQRDAVDDVNGVDHVAQRLADLPTMRVTHHRVEKHLQQHTHTRTYGGMDYSRTRLKTNPTNDSRIELNSQL